jgi:hypothetical protein
MMASPWRAARAAAVSPRVPPSRSEVCCWCGSPSGGQPVARRAGGGRLPPRPPLQVRGVLLVWLCTRWPARGGFTDGRRGSAAPAPTQVEQPLFGKCREAFAGEEQPLLASAREGGTRGEASAPRVSLGRGSRGGAAPSRAQSCACRPAATGWWAIAIQVWRRVRALFTSQDELSIELVMTANGVAALAVAVIVWFQFGLAVPGLAVTVVGAFLVLFACLLFRHTVWIAAGLGGLALATSGALVLGSLMDGLPHGRLLGSGLGVAGGLAVAFSTYRQVGRIARSRE